MTGNQPRGGPLPPTRRFGGIRVIAFSLALLGSTTRADDELKEHTITMGDSIRRVFVHRPIRTREGARLPVVMILHGGGGKAEALHATYGFRPFIEKGECIAVYPSAIAGQWMPTTDEVRFLDAVLDQVIATEPVDPRFLFLTGASRGGIMTFYALPRLRHPVRAAGTVIAGILPAIATEFRLDEPVDFLMINGTDDPLIPFAGGWGAMRTPRRTGSPDAKILPIRETIEMVARENGIATEPVVSTLGDTDPTDGCTNEVLTWQAPDDSTRTVLIRVIGGGHVVPGGRQYLPKAWIGAACRDFDHAEVMWRFFRESMHGPEPPEKFPLVR